MKHPLAKQFLALPGYLGGKRKLLQWIAQKLNTVIPNKEWPSLSFIDLFMGGGSVSLWAKAQGFDQVISNDISYRSKLLAQAFLLNKDVRLTIENIFTLTQPLPEDATPWIETTYGGSVFSQRHAKALDQGFLLGTPTSR